MREITHMQNEPELDHIEVHGTTRAAFILRGALATGAVYGMSTVGPFVSGAFAKGGGDVDILNFALTLEFLEADFYNVTGKKVGLSGKAKTLAREIGDHEAQHVDALKATIKKLGGTPVKSPKFSFPVTNQQGFLKLAQTLEDTGVGAYNGAAPAIQSKDVLAAAGSIVQVEARHAAAIRNLRGSKPAPFAFDKAIMKADVLKAVTPLIKK